MLDNVVISFQFPSNCLVDDLNVISGILFKVLIERVKQDQQWSGPTHDDAHALKDWSLFINKQAKFVEKLDKGRSGRIRVPDGQGHRAGGRRHRVE